MLFLFISVLLCCGTTQLHAQLLSPEIITVVNCWQDYAFWGTDLKNNAEFNSRFRWFINQLNADDTNQAKTALNNYFEALGLRTKSFTQGAKMIEMVYNYPNSPLRSEFLGLYILGVLSKSKYLSETDRNNYAKDLVKAKLNRTGSKANNIHYFNSAGKSSDLYSIDAEFTLVYFYNPECDACKEMSEILLSDVLINQLLKQQRMVLLAVYTDSNEQEWKNHLKTKPSWQHGWDKLQTIEKNKLYYLNAIPSIYLLDQNKNVLIKDATFDQLQQYFLAH